jgi:hypothetical protein
MRHILARRIRQVLLVPGGFLKWTAMGSQGGLLTKHKLAYPVPSPRSGFARGRLCPGVGRTLNHRQEPNQRSHWYPKCHWSEFVSTKLTAVRVEATNTPKEE